MKKGTHRLILDMQKFDIDVFDEFGRYNYLSTQTILPTHMHSDMIEICYLSKGSQECFVGEQTFKLLGGDVFITLPNEIHGTGDIPEEKGVLYWMVLKAPQEGKDYLGLSYVAASEIFKHLLNTPTRLFKGDSECEKLLQQIVNKYFANKSILVKVELEILLVSFLLNIIRCGKRAYHRQYSQSVMNTIYYINEHIFEDFTLDSLADMCNLSLSRFKHRFKEETGIPPAEYIIRIKIEKARALIEEDAFSIKDIAYDLGFSSPSYFSTVFKQYNGYSPSEYLSKKR